MRQSVWLFGVRIDFQCSSASRKFLNRRPLSAVRAEPTSFSALQRAENSSIVRLRRETRDTRRLSVLFSEPKIPQLMATVSARFAPTTFQCSSASRKFLNLEAPPTLVGLLGFQCSSASRKFLNWRCASLALPDDPFQCSSASRKFLNRRVAQHLAALRAELSVLFSEPKIPQSGLLQANRTAARLSVLFSEPKIPQS